MNKSARVGNHVIRVGPRSFQISVYRDVRSGLLEVQALDGFCDTLTTIVVNKSTVTIIQNRSYIFFRFLYGCLGSNESGINFPTLMRIRLLHFLLT